MDEAVGKVVILEGSLESSLELVARIPRGEFEDVADAGRGPLSALGDQVRKEVDLVGESLEEGLLEQVGLLARTAARGLEVGDLQQDLPRARSNLWVARSFAILRADDEPVIEPSPSDSWATS